jgi:hypothetical protein
MILRYAKNYLGYKEQYLAERAQVAGSRLASGE